ncbi:hypothetical protein V5799_024809 [Amblyomma americanum]|uniref:Uncharacterized protein n=1 Tax=Amblyomma americanum TaxID=6943 RepID=A0AAQ4EB46_AMBAM
MGPFWGRQPAEPGRGKAGLLEAGAPGAPTIPAKAPAAPAAPGSHPTGGRAGAVVGLPGRPAAGPGCPRRGSGCEELGQLDEKLVRMLAWQRLQQLRGSQQIPNGPAVIMRSEVQARAMVCPVGVKGSPVPMLYRTLALGSGGEHFSRVE